MFLFSRQGVLLEMVLPLTLESSTKNMSKVKPSQTKVLVLKKETAAFILACVASSSLVRSENKALVKLTKAVE